MQCFNNLWSKDRTSFTTLELWPDCKKFFNDAKLEFCLQVNVGCVPKKVMFNTAMMMEFLHDMKGYGYEVEVKNFNWR